MHHRRRRRSRRAPGSRARRRRCTPALGRHRPSSAETSVPPEKAAGVAYVHAATMARGPVAAVARRAWERVWRWVRALPWRRFAAGAIGGVGALFLTYVL